MAAVCCSIAFSFSAYGADTDTIKIETTHKESNADECSKELLLTYFPKPFVNETLKKYNIPQEKWDAINSQLSEKDKQVISIVEEKASKMNPNPLKDAQQRQAAVKIFRETLRQIFSEVMKNNGITDEKQIDTMLDDIQQQKAKRFAQCMERRKTADAPASEKAKMTSSSQKAGQSSDEDEDDEDDDDDDDSEDDDEDDQGQGRGYEGKPSNNNMKPATPRS